MIGRPAHKMRKAFQALVINDCCKIRDFPPDSFDVILDVGSCLGMFSVFARFVQPRARIIAVEPEPEFIEIIRENTQNLNIGVVPFALGNGQTLYKYHFDETHPWRAYYATEQEEDIPEGAISCPSLTLRDIFQKCDIPLDCRYFIKMDVEGGERFALVDEYFDIFEHAIQTSVELHTNGLGVENIFRGIEFIKKLESTHHMHTYSRRKGWVIRKKEIPFIDGPIV